MRPLSQIEVREIDQRALSEYGVPSIVLMENAGRGCSEVVFRQWDVGRAVICCGRGNNGGDGFVMARHLENAGWTVQVRIVGPIPEMGGDAATMRGIIERAGIDCRTPDPDKESWKLFQADLAQANLVVDALLGSGLRGPAREPYLAWIEAINACGRPVLAIDLPSGMDCNTGKPLGNCVRATRTATMVAPKLGFENPYCRELTGPVEVIGIGVPRALLADVESVGTRMPAG